MPVHCSDVDDLVARLRACGVAKGDHVGLALLVGVGVGVAVGVAVSDGGAGAGDSFALATADPSTAVVAIEAAFRPRWTFWSAADGPPTTLVPHGVRIATCFDVAAAHRLLAGGWQAAPPVVWAEVHGLERASVPELGQLDLLGHVDPTADASGHPDDPVQPDGHLRPEWVAGGWSSRPERLAGWAATALAAAERQRGRLAGLECAGDAAATARVESAAELLCVELAHDGLPVDRVRATQLIEAHLGPRPRTEAEAAAGRARRDAEVLEHLPPGSGLDLRSPIDVRTLLRRVGIDVPDTRAWRLEALRDVHPVVDALLTWRKAERIATTFGWGWLDQHVGADGRLRGTWTASDGAAGRMTAQAGLHNLPAELRPAVVADDGHVFVRADLGQIEPRVLAAVSDDRVLAQATGADDLYLPIAQRLGVDRPTAKVAVLAAMYGQTSGTAGRALEGLERAYPVAMGFLRDADRSGRDGIDLRTFGGRRLRMDWGDDPLAMPESRRATIAARGRFARNAVVQGAAAELFKAWAVTVRARVAPLQARIVLCLHDELLLHVPDAHAAAAAEIVDACLAEASHRWFGPGVRFVADTSTIRSWADAH